MRVHDLPHTMLCCKAVTPREVKGTKLIMSPEFWMAWFRATYEWQKACGLAMLNGFRMMGDAAKALLDTAANHTADPQHKVIQHRVHKLRQEQGLAGGAREVRWADGYERGALARRFVPYGYWGHHIFHEIMI